MKKYIFLLVCAFSLQLKAQTTVQDPQKELGVWYMYNGSHQLSDDFSIKSMAHFRFYEIGSDMRQFIGRAGLNYKINNTFSATLGYAYLSTDRTFSIDGGYFGDHRIYEDFNIKHKLAKLSFAHRIRAEQRFFESQTGHLIRYQLGLGYPLSEKWSSYVYDEVFFDFTDTIYNQNWFGLGFKYKLSKAVKLQLGYMNISINGGPTFDRIQLGVAISTDHRKKNNQK
ncbi:DUF2490 domain-containing protein [Tenacibaculum sp. M341]|uniref:DUF2490 domain-containing protein n=1 Tax=Tenacibaculum sp. M341 TaxID=2530339 RepID=UPI00104946D0|nr:DUF2490 domain-containing protein [Tenacibaculum sp. M341]TCI91899.1 DUF2490 domain-containing protein [Tenacibaculum sp. M341]